MDAPHQSRSPRVLDPRLYQIASLSGLLIYGVLALDFEVGIARVAVILATALIAQWLCGKLWKLPAYDPRSALISGLSLCLLLGTNLVGGGVREGVVPNANKFRGRWKGKPPFNPTN